MMNHYKQALKNLNTQSEKMDFLKKVPFDVNITKKNELITLSIPCLTLKINGVNLNKLMIEIEKKKEQYFTEMIHINSEDEICFPPQLGPAGGKDVLQAFIKLLMAYKKLFIILILFFIALKSCSNVSKSIKKAKHRMNEKMAYNIHHETPEKLLKRKKRVASFLNFLGPYYVQLKIFEKKSELKAQEIINDQSLKSEKKK